MLNPAFINSNLSKIVQNEHIWKLSPTTFHTPHNFLLQMKQTPSFVLQENRNLNTSAQSFTIGDDFGFVELE